MTSHFVFVVKIKGWDRKSMRFERSFIVKGPPALHQTRNCRVAQQFSLNAHDRTTTFTRNPKLSGGHFHPPQVSFPVSPQNSLDQLANCNKQQRTDVAKLTFDLYKNNPKDFIGCLNVKATLYGVYSVSCDLRCFAAKKMLK